MHDNNYHYLVSDLCGGENRRVKCARLISLVEFFLACVAGCILVFQTCEVKNSLGGKAAIGHGQNRENDAASYAVFFLPIGGTVGLCNARNQAKFLADREIFANF